MKQTHQMINLLRKLLVTLRNTELIQIGPKLWAKNESMNLTGSIKIRMACWVIMQSLVKGLLKPGMTVVEATSGNTGIALAKVCELIGINFIAIMPCNMTEQRIVKIKSYGGEVQFVDANDFSGAVALRDELVAKNGWFTTNQFANEENIRSHYMTTGPEILRQAQENKLIISALVAGTGTAGTLIGLWDKLQEEFPNMVAVAVEPSESAVMMAYLTNMLPIVTGHKIGGIGDGFIPPLMRMNQTRFVSTVSSQDAIARTLRLKNELGLPVGYSSGANVFAAEKYINEYNPRYAVITILPDHEDRYN